MAIDNQEEYEQGEQVRNWLRSNGSSVIGGIAIGLALISGWQWWQHKQDLRGQQAAASYAAFTDAVNNGSDDSRVTALADSLRADYGKTPYVTLAALRLAARKLDKKDAKGALAILDGIGKTPDTAMNSVVQLRAARVLLILSRPKDALARIEPIKDQAFAGISGELRGDAEQALGHLDLARQAYIDALAHLPASAPNRSIIAMKLAEIGGVAPKPEAVKA